MKSKPKLAIFISGRGSNMSAILSSWKDGKIQIDPVVVLSSNPKAEGIEIAQQFGLPTIISERKKDSQTLSEYGSRILEAIEPYSPDIIALAGFMQILSPRFIQSFPGIILNIHPSLLPSFPGLNPHQQALEAQVKISGCTVHLVTAKVDSGGIIAQAAVPVFPADSEFDLAERILREEHLLYPATIAGIASGKMTINDDKITIKYPSANLDCGAADPHRSLRSWDLSMSNSDIGGGHD